MTFETELREHLHAGVDDTDVDLGSLLTGSVAYGNKLVRRRRLTRIIGGAATIAVLGGAFAYAGSLSDPINDTPAPAGQREVVQQKTDITPQATGKLLLDLLPNAKAATNYRGGYDGKTGQELGVYALVDYTDGGSTAMVRVEIIKTAYPQICGPKEQGCSVTTLPDGSKLQLIDQTDDMRDDDASHYRHLAANLIRKDGLNLNVLAINYRQDNPNTSPTRPPVSIEQLKAIATSPRWQLKLDQAFVNGAGNLFAPRLLTQPSAPEQIGVTPTPAAPGSPTAKPSGAVR